MSKIIQHPLPFWEEREDAPIEMLVLHCSAHAPDEMIGVLTERKLSAHYIIGEDGQILQLVPEEKRAWHAGESFWRGKKMLNRYSIGIELSSMSMGQAAYPAAQIKALSNLCRQIMARYGIRPQNVVAHSDVAPTRKPDPGMAFPWQKLAEKGIGLWYDLTDAAKVAEDDVAVLLAQIGYDVSDLAAASYAFCRHFAPQYVQKIGDIDTLIENVYPADFAFPAECLPILQACAWKYNHIK
jgi:N-acetylmuramoyl-L-alanine amidase